MNAKKIIVLLLCAVLLLAFAGCDSRDYASAISLMESGQWTDARELFASLGDYEDSPAMLTECDYNIALAGMEAGDYEAAAAQFEALGDYKDSTELFTECSYHNAVALYEQGDYESAIAAFEALGDYEDSAELLADCSYLSAVSLYEDGKYEEALSIFRTMEDYKDADHYSVVCMLLTDSDGYIDSFVEGMLEGYRYIGAAYELEESTSDYGDDRSFLVSGYGSSGETYLIFSHLNEDGASTANGQINGITVIGDATTSEEILLVYPEFAFSAGIALNVLDDSSSLEELVLMVNSEVEKLLESDTSEGHFFAYEFEYEGYECSISTLIYDDIIRFGMKVFVPELAE